MSRSSNTRILDGGRSEYYREAEPIVARGHVDSGAACSIGLVGPTRSQLRSRLRDASPRACLRHIGAHLDDRRAGLPRMSN